MQWHWFAILGAHLIVTGCSLFLGESEADEAFHPGIEALARLRIIGENPYDYGSLWVGQRSTRSFVLTNAGSFPLTLQSQAFSSEDFEIHGLDFPGEGGTCPTTLPPGAECVLPIDYAPYVGGANHQVMTLYFEYRGKNHSTQLQLNGHGYTGESGTIDTQTFGASGLVQVGADYVLFDIAIQTNRRILGVGQTSGGMNAVRLLENGVIDTSFSTDGWAIGSVGTGITISNAVRLQSDGKSVVFGYGVNGNAFGALVRYRTDGSLDTDFGTSGVAIHAVGGVGLGFNEGGIQTDGKLVAVGFGDTEIFLARYLTSGSLDTSFHTDGLLLTNPTGGNESGNRLVFTTDGKILVAGHLQPSAEVLLLRYESDGQLDLSFGTNGWLMDDWLASFWFLTSHASTIELQTDGKFLLGANKRGDLSFGFSRYRSDGHLDTTFATNGRLTTSYSNDSHVIQSVKINKNGSFYAFGNFTTDAATYNPVVARFLSNGSVDTSFHGTGYLTVANSGTGFPKGFAVQRDGKVVLSGHAGDKFNFIRVWP